MQIYYPNEKVNCGACGFDHFEVDPCPPHAEVKAQEDPETGEYVYPWFSADGSEVSSTGYVYGCSCATCESRKAGK